LSTAELFQGAVADFDSALAYATDSMRIANLARVGRARALLNLARYADAATSAASVPTPYVYATEHGAGVQPNAVFQFTNSLLITVADREGQNGLPYRSAGDPRVGTRLLGKGTDRVTDVYLYTKYASLGAPVTLASGVEARLVEAEATLKAGNADGALRILNALRATVAGLAPLAPESTPAGQVDQLFRERAFWLFATGHRHGDLRRLVRQYGRAATTVFPTGPYRGGLTYGDDITFAPDVTQRDNPRFTGCVGRGA
jgi:hypothetical protein